MQLSARWKLGRSNETRRKTKIAEAGNCMGKLTCLSAFAYGWSEVSFKHSTDGHSIWSRRSV